MQWMLWKASEPAHISDVRINPIDFRSDRMHQRIHFTLKVYVDSAHVYSIFFVLTATNYVAVHRKIKKQRKIATDIDWMPNGNGSFSRSRYVFLLRAHFFRFTTLWCNMIYLHLARSSHNFRMPDGLVCEFALKMDDWLMVLALNNDRYKMYI